MPDGTGRAPFPEGCGLCAGMPPRQLGDLHDPFTGNSRRTGLPCIHELAQGGLRSPYADGGAVRRSRQRTRLCLGSVHRRGGRVEPRDPRCPRDLGSRCSVRTRPTESRTQSFFRWLPRHGWLRGLRRGFRRYFGHRRRAVLHAASDSDALGPAFRTDSAGHSPSHRLTFRRW